MTQKYTWGYLKLGKTFGDITAFQMELLVDTKPPMS